MGAFAPFHLPDDMVDRRAAAVLERPLRNRGEGILHAGLPAGTAGFLEAGADAVVELVAQIDKNVLGLPFGGLRVRGDLGFADGKVPGLKGGRNLVQDAFAS